MQGKEYTGLEIAVVGMAGRFPGAEDVERFWKVLRDGVECVRGFSDEELLEAGVPRGLFESAAYIRSAAVLEDIAGFDAGFFGYSPRDAEIIDPQQRVFLECAWSAVEHAGYNPLTYGKRMGVFGGVGANGYWYHILSHPELVGKLGYMPLTLANEKDYLTTRVSYKLNLEGPSVLIQSACSTSLVAVHMACQSLLSGECSMALAGGVSLRVPQKGGYVYQEEGILSPDGKCRPFDADARGTVVGNGAGMVALKRLEDAWEDGDTIHAVIKGSAVNNDGGHKAGFTAPRVQGQAKVVRSACAAAQVHPESISYIEAHGTGTAVGDPIEIDALTEAFRAKTGKQRFCAIGSVKGNVGHMDAAAGITGFIKTVLALKHGLIPPSLNFEKPNPKIDFENSPFYVANTLREWKPEHGLRRAGVSSFGLGGTNAHVILEEAPRRESKPALPGVQILTLSARSREALEEMTRNLAVYLKEHPELDGADVAYTLQMGRKVFACRRAVIVDEGEDAAAKLEALSTEEGGEDKGQDGEEGGVVFMFPGQGSQYPGMGAELYEREPVFREEVDACCEVLKTETGMDFREIVFSRTPGESASEELCKTSVVQPALFTVEYALARLWMSWGVKPVAMIGHSVGEYVAACLSGVFMREEALRLVAARGGMMQEMPGGRMLAVPLEEEDARRYAKETGNQVSIAAINAPGMTVLSGPRDAMDELEALLEGEGIVGRRLQTSHAFHSVMMEPVVEVFVKRVAQIALRPPQIPFISNVTGSWIRSEDAMDPNYWARQLRREVRFSDGMRTLLGAPARKYLEVGPGNTLATLARKHDAFGEGGGKKVLTSLQHARQGEGTAIPLYESVGGLWCGGENVDWRAFHEKRSPGVKRLRVPLPAYPFQRKAHWIERRQVLSEPVKNSHDPGVMISGFEDWFYIPRWKRCPLATSTGEDSNISGVWLVFAGEGELSKKVLEELGRIGATVFTVESGGAFAKEKKDGRVSYTVNPREAVHYDMLAKDIKAADVGSLRILHLWPASGETPTGEWKDALEYWQARGFLSLWFLARALGEAGMRKETRLVAVSRGMQRVDDEEGGACPYQATLLGACRVIPKEFSWFGCRSVDLDAELLRGSGTDWTAKHLIMEFEGETSEGTVAYRGGERKAFHPEKIRLEKKRETNGGVVPRLRRKGVYLITGGLGSMGLAMAEYLVDQVGAKVVLIGRSGLPPREEWDGLLLSAKNAFQDPLIRKISRIREMEKKGGEIWIAAADVADEVAMRSLLSEVEEGFGSVNGVIHAAGILGPGLVQAQTLDALGAVFKPKVEGALVLNECFKDRELDFLIHCSSVSSVTPLVGQSAYAAANLFLDAFAGYQARENGMPAISVGWGYWQEPGIAAQAGGTEPLERWIHSVEEKHPGAGLEILERVLETEKMPHVLVSPNELPSGIESGWKIVGRQTEISKRTGRQGTRGGDPGVAKAGEERSDFKNVPEREIAEIWKDLLGVERIGRKDDFFDLGGDSLLGLRLIAGIRDKFGVKLPLATLFEASTVEGLAEIVLKNAESEKVEEWENQDRPKRLFFAHGFEGNILGFRDLGRRLSKMGYPMHALFVPEIDRIENHETFYRDIVDRNLEEILEVQNEGVFYLAGHCSGALFAFELAHRLLDLGHEVAAVIFFDSPPEMFYPDAFPSERTRMTYHVREFLKAPLSKKWSYFRRRLHSLKERFKAKADERYVDLHRAYLAFHGNYKPEPLPAPVVVCLPTDSHYIQRPGIDFKTFWGQLVAPEGRLHLHYLAANHINMGMDPQAETLAFELEAYLKRTGVVTETFEMAP